MVRDSKYQRGSNTSQTSGCSSSSGNEMATSSASFGVAESSRKKQDEQPSPISCFFNALSRKKPLDCRTDTDLNRCLNLLDLTALGVGSTLGLGLYVLAGQVASQKAGPAVVISFVLAALASAFSALCYAEFAGRVPRAGSAYAYSYITVGEFVAFIIGWNLILEYVIGASSVARGFSTYLRIVFQHVATSFDYAKPNQINLNQSTVAGSSNFSTITPDSHFGENYRNSSSTNLTQLMLKSAASTGALASSTWLDAVLSYVYRYFDWPSVAIIIVITAFILFGVKESTNVTMACTTLNLLVVFAVVISSISSLDLHNWRLSSSEVPAGYGEGGFAPYGWSGILAGSATCFFGFIGFDTIASSAEEAKNPKRNVPLSILLSLAISALAYVAIAVVQTLLWPYYDQNKPTTLPYIFGRLDMPITYWVVLLGAIAGLASSQLGGMYPLPRIIYSMANDKLIYSFLAAVNRRLKLPVKATIVGSAFVALLACLLDIEDLADMVSIGTLTAYSLVSLSVLILRYEDRSDAVDDSTIMSNHIHFTDILNNLEHSTADLSDTSIDLHQLKMRGALEGDKEVKCDGQADLGGKSLDNGPKLTAKPSSPIHEKGSKAVVPQLSAGFQSWLKSDKLSDEQTGAENILSCGKEQNQQQQSLLDLLISWKANDQAGERMPNDQSSRQSKILILIIVCLTIVLNVVASCLTYSEGPNQADVHPLIGFLGVQKLIDPKVLLASGGCISLVVLAASMLMLSRLPVSRTVQADMFQVPLVPLIPTLSILVNTCLMLNLSYLTWIRFTVWMTFGLFIYFTYGIWNSEGYLLYLGR